MIRIILALIIILSMLGCGSDNQDPPIIFSIKAEPKIVSPGESSTITVEAGDPDKNKISYLWIASGGQVIGTGKTITWTSPKDEGKYELTVTVSDGSKSTKTSISVRVWTPRPGDYYPLTIGNKWTFLDKENNQIDFEVIDTIDISGTKAFVKRLTISNNEGANYFYFAKGNDVINLHAISGSSAGDDTIIFSPTLPSYKFPLITGESWEIEFDVNTPDGFYVGSGKAKYDVISEEDLSVKAGTFGHVFQVQEDFTWEIIGQELDHTLSRQWLAPNVGIVKFVTEQTRGGEALPKTEAELQSYSLK